MIGRGGKVFMVEDIKIIIRFLKLKSKVDNNKRLYVKIL